MLTLEQSQYQLMLSSVNYFSLGLIIIALTSAGGKSSFRWKFRSLSVCVSRTHSLARCNFHVVGPAAAAAALLYPHQRSLQLRRDFTGKSFPHSISRGHFSRYVSNIVRNDRLFNAFDYVCSLVSASTDVQIAVGVDWISLSLSLSRRYI